MDADSDNYRELSPFLLIEITQRFRKAMVDISGPRVYNGRTWDNSFTGKEAMTWIMDNTFAKSRPAAEWLGQQIFNRNAFAHVVYEHGFRDKEYFYHLVPDAHFEKWEEFVKAFQTEFHKIKKDRDYNGLKYREVFLGDEAADWIVRNTLMTLGVKTRPHAIDILKKLHGSFVFRHVLEEHDYEDSGYFYQLRECQYGIRVPLSDGEQLYIRKWRAGNPIAVVLFVHGIGDHINRFEKYFTVLSDQGITVLAYDQRGFGNSSGVRGKASLAQLVSDLKFVSGLPGRDRDLAGLPIFAYGHGMGAIVLLQALLNHPPPQLPIQGLIMTCPMIGVQVEVPSDKRIVGKLIAGFGATARAQVNIKSSDITKSPEVAASWEMDPIRHDWIAPSLGSELLEFESKMEKEALNIKLPVLLLHAAEDRVGSLSAGVEFINRCGSLDQTHVSFSGAWYDMENDIEGFTLATYISTWIKARWPPQQGLVVRAKATMPAITPDIALATKLPDVVPPEAHQIAQDRYRDTQYAPTAESIAASASSGSSSSSSNFADISRSFAPPPAPAKKSWAQVRPSLVIKNSKGMFDTQASPQNPQ